MSIIKNKLIRRFTTVPNQIITDLRVTNRAMRVFLYLLSKPDQWQVINADIQKQLDIKDAHTMADCWTCLIESGWITREAKKTTSGLFNGGYDYELNETPNCEKSPIPATPDLGKNRNAEKPQLGQNHIHSNTEINNIDNTSDINNCLHTAFDDEKTKNILDKMHDDVFETWQKIAKENNVKFTNKEWDIIYGYIQAKPNLRPHEILTNIHLLIKWAGEGLDIEDALLTGMAYRTLKKPNAKFTTDSKTNQRIYGIPVITARLKQIEREEQEHGNK